MRYAIHAVLFAAIGALIAAQSDPVEGLLIDGYHGLRLAMIACFAASIVNLTVLVCDVVNRR